MQWMHYHFAHRDFGAMPFPVAAALYLFGILAVAALLHRFVERPFSALAHRR
jgi:peptidoglycan/LPS O-acetylase OafA/YrhL